MRQKCFVGETNPILYRNDSINIDGTFFSQAFFLGVHFLSCHRFMHRSKRHQKTTNKINHRKLCCAITTTNVAIFLPLLFICQPTDQKYTQNNCLFSRFAEDAKRERLVTVELASKCYWLVVERIFSFAAENDMATYSRIPFKFIGYNLNATDFIDIID